MADDTDDERKRELEVRKLELEIEVAESTVEKIRAEVDRMKVEQERWRQEQERWRRQDKHETFRLITYVFAAFIAAIGTVAAIYRVVVGG